MDYERFKYIVNRERVMHSYRFGEGYTYIAKSEDGKVYKVGFSWKPLNREKKIGGDYAKFGFKMAYLFRGNIECEILSGLSIAGAKLAVPEGKSSKHREAYYLSQQDVQFLIEYCFFKPIDKFNI